MKIRIGSFDIGKKNFAQYIEEILSEDMYKLREEHQSLPKNKQRRVKGPMNDSILKILEKVYKSGERVSIGVYDLRDDKESNKYDIETRKNLIKHLNNHRNLFATCDAFVIEQQFYRKWTHKKKSNAEANMDAVKIAEGLVMWLLKEFPDKHVEYFSAQFKTQILGAPNHLTDAKRKQWAVDKTEEIFNMRGDKSMIELFEFKKKVYRKRKNTVELQEKLLLQFPEWCSEDAQEIAKRHVVCSQKFDDISDVVVQCQAFKYRNLIANF